MLSYDNIFSHNEINRFFTGVYCLSVFIRFCIDNLVLATLAWAFAHVRLDPT